MNASYRKTLAIVFFLIAIPFCIPAKSVCFFTPPKGWEFIDPKNLEPQIQIAFIGTGQSDFRPSINLATEEIDISLKEYLKSVKEIHEKELNVRWRDLGSFTFTAGKGRLAEITSPSPMGEVKMLQGIFVQNGYAYILTAAVLKDEFSRFQKDLIDTMHSLTVAPDYFSAIVDETKKSALQKDFCSFDQLQSPEERDNEWNRLQKIVLEEHASLGSCWHFMVLKDGYSRIFQSSLCN